MAAVLACALRTVVRCRLSPCLAGAGTRRVGKQLQVPYPKKQVYFTGPRPHQGDQACCSALPAGMPQRGCRLRAADRAAARVQLSTRCLGESMRRRSLHGTASRSRATVARRASCRATRRSATCA